MRLTTKKPPRWSRLDYNKPHRCPGWSGAGWVISNRSTWGCQNGSVRSARLAPREDWSTTDLRPWQRHAYPTDHPWTHNFCWSCGVKFYPHALRWLDPHWYRIYKYKIENWMRWTKGWLKK